MLNGVQSSTDVALLGDYFFFFQAEDGIRDGRVTGVQTCALPISRGRHHHGPRPEDNVYAAVVTRAGEIGRASCRERVEILVVAGLLKKKDVDANGNR